MSGARPVAVIGGGLSGIACARQLHDAGIPVRVYERGHKLGGRMAVRTERLPSGPHPVDIGAPYFTVRQPGFRAVVDGWQARGLARPWTDTFTLSSPDGRIGSTSSPQRWSSGRGLRALVEDLADGLDVRLRTEVSAVTIGADGLPLVDGEPAPAVVLAMPDPQAARLLPPELAAELDVASGGWSPALCVWAAWSERWWPAFEAAFVDGGASLAWVSDDGRSRGDGAPVLVAHSTAAFAAAHLDDVESAIAPMLAELPQVLGSGPMPAPERVRVHRWSLASPKHPHVEPFVLHGGSSGGSSSGSAGGRGGALVGICGDGWGERSRVEQAWTSGDLLGAELAEVLARRPG